MKLIWLPSAYATREEQIDYIAQDSPLSAASQDEEIERQVDMLLAHPYLGRPGRVKTTRELVIGRTPFIVAYRVKGESIEILRVLHTAMQWPRSLGAMLKN